MKIIMKVSMAGKQGVFPAGTVRELEEAKALHLINVGFAKKYIEPEQDEKPKVPSKDTTSSRTSKPKRSKSTPKARRK